MIECPKETAYLFYHQGTPSDCQLCTPKIGLYYFASFEREPYELPLHNHCICSWEVIELSGIFSAKKEELANDLTRMESDLIGHRLRNIKYISSFDFYKMRT